MLKFELGDHIFLHVSPIKRIIRIWSERKVNSYIHWTFWDFETDWCNSLSTYPTSSLSESAQSLSCFYAAKVCSKSNTCPIGYHITPTECKLRGIFSLYSGSQETSIAEKCIQLVKVRWQYHFDQEAIWEQNMRMKCAQDTLPFHLR